MGWPSTSLSTWARAQSASMRTIGFAASLLDLHISVMSPNPSTPSQPAISLPLSRYCHKVAGLVGEGLSRAFVVRGLESAQICGQGAIVWPFCPAPKASPVEIMFSAFTKTWGEERPNFQPERNTATNPDEPRYDSRPRELDGSFSAEDEHHSRLFGRLRRWACVLAARGDLWLPRNPIIAPSCCQHFRHVMLGMETFRAHERVGRVCPSDSTWCRPLHERFRFQVRSSGRGDCWQGHVHFRT